MPNYFKPYNGDGQYVFVSYSHANSSKVLEILNGLKDSGYRIWYDEGIPAGSDWPLSVQKHLQLCDTVLFFKSEYSLDSDNCFSEIRTAAKLGKKIICVHLDDSAFKDEWEDISEKLISTEDIHADLDDNLKGPYDDDTIIAGKDRAPLAILLIISIVALAAAVTMFAIAYTGKLDSHLGIETAISDVRTPAPTVDIELPNTIEFPDKVQEKAVRYALGVSDDEEIESSAIPDIKELYICGNMPLKNADDMEYDDNGNCLVNGAPVKGSVDDLSFISGLAYLEKLVITKQNITDISKLSGLKLLSELDISGNPVESLEGIDGFISLEKLNIEHTDIKDLSPLTALPGLKKVYVSRDMLPLVIPDSAEFETVLVR